MTANLPVLMVVPVTWQTALTGRLAGLTTKWSKLTSPCDSAGAAGGGLRPQGPEPRRRPATSGRSGGPRWGSGVKPERMVGRPWRAPHAGTNLRAPLPRPLYRGRHAYEAEGSQREARRGETGVPARLPRVRGHRQGVRGRARIAAPLHRRLTGGTLVTDGTGLTDGTGPAVTPPRPSRGPARR